LEELRWRLIKAGSIAVAGFILCYWKAKDLIAFLQKPLFAVLPPEKQTLYFTNPLEVFMAHIKVGVVGGLALAFPFILFQAWQFVGPGLYGKEKRFVIP